MLSKAEAAWCYSQEGEPSHYVLLRVVARALGFAVACEIAEDERQDRSFIGDVISNRAHARRLALEVLMEELCDVAIFNDWPLPREVVVYVPRSEEEGQ